MADDEPTAPPRATDVADLLVRAAAENPDKLALVEAGGRSITWAELEDEVGRLATGLGAAGVVAGHRVMIVMGNRLEFVASYLGILRAQAVAVPVNPTATAGELARMIADSGVAAGDGRLRRGHRGPRGAGRPGRGDGGRPPGRVDRGRPVLPPGASPGGGGRRDPAAGRTLLRPPPRRAGARRSSAPGPGEAGGAALHERYVGAPARRDADAPRAARQHRPGRLGRPADDPRRRRGAGRAADVPRLRAQRRPRGRDPPPGQDRARRAVRPAGHPGPDRGRGVQRHPGRAAGVRLLARHRRPA